MLKAFLIGVVGVAVISGINYFNDNVLQQNILISNHMPAVVYGGLILFLFLLNPLLFKMGRKWALTPGQMAVILAMVLTACTVPGFGLLRTLSTSLMLPHYHSLRLPGWKEQKVLELVPPKMLADPSKNESESLFGFVQGLGVGEKHISFSRIPWYAWSRTLIFWIPFVVLLWIALISLSVIVHKQWSQHEQLPYPIVKFANAIIPAEGSPLPEIFRNRMFQIACFSIMGIHLVNYLYLWFPNSIQIPITFQFGKIGELFPTFTKGGGASLLEVNLYFTVIAFAYFLASRVSLSLWVGPFLWCLIVGLFANYGISFEGGGGYLAPRILSFLNFGAYLGFIGITVYWGRQYYFSVLKNALFITRAEPAERPYTWSARIFLVTFLILVFYLASTGLDWQLAFLYIFGAVVIFLAMGRIVSETGLFFLQAWTFPCVMIWGLFGERALGAQALATMFLVTIIILLDPRESIIPYLSNSFKLVEIHKVSIGKTAVFCVLAVLIALAIALPITLYFQYDKGANFADSWTIKSASFPFDNALQIKQRLLSQGNLDFAESLSGWKRFLYLSPKKSLVIALLAGILLVVGFSFGHVNFSRWPLHPVLFLIWSTMPAQRFAGSFLLGWLIRYLVVKYGGDKSYVKLKPLMFGLIAGDMVGLLLPVLIGLAYHFLTGRAPVAFG